MTKRFGFTLAEVLITLGIIGVVAAMTIPTLIANTSSTQFKTAYKKTLSTLNQAALMNIALNDYDFSSLVKEPDGKRGANADGLTARTMSSILLGKEAGGQEKVIQGTNVTAEYDFTGLAGMKYTLSNYTCTEDDESAEGPCTDSNVGQEVALFEKAVNPSATDWTVIRFADNTAFGYFNDAADCSGINTNCIGFIDANAATTPNKVTVCTSGDEGGTGTPDEVTGAGGACEVGPGGVYDVFPVFIHGQTIEPASDAARAVLFGK